MKILFAIEDLFYLLEPLGIMQIIAMARRAGHRCLFAPYADPGFLPLVEREKPDVVAISIMSHSHASCREAVARIKACRRDIFVIVGGSHPTFFPEFIRSCDADALCVGEGEFAFLDVLEALAKDAPVDGIPNIVTKRNANPTRNLVEDLDALPWVDRELLGRTTRLGHLRLKSFMATRGCPFSCTYCFNSGYKALYRGKGRILRRRSVDSVIGEIQAVRAAFPLAFIRFADDVLIEGVNDWFREFVEKYGRTVHLPFYCLVNPRTVTPEMAQLLKKAGCVSASTSIETGNERLRTEVLKRRVTNEEILTACRLLDENGIRTFTNLMVGLPGSSTGDDISSVEFAAKCRSTCISVTIFTPFAGTELYRQCVENNLIDEPATPSFPRGTMDRSVLSCFTEREKDIQKNLMLLAPLCKNRLLRGLILGRLVFLPTNRLFFYVSFLARNFYYRRIWPVPVGIVDFFRYVGFILRQDRKHIG